MGRCGAGAMGPEPLTWTECAAWAQMTGCDPAPWEAETLMLLSREFVAELSREGTHAPPWDYTATLTDLDRERIVAWQKVQMSGRASRRNNR